MSQRLVGSITAWMPGYQEFSRVRKKWKRKLFGFDPPKIRTKEFESTCPSLHSTDTLDREISSICRYEKLSSPKFRAWIEKLGLPFAPHRKLWELAYICQALDERQMLQAGRKGLGFAVGTEVLPAYFASRGIEVVGTDLAGNDKRNKRWAKTGQWASGLEALKKSHLCDDATFGKNVRFRPVDMNQIPEDLTGFDFTWSTCSFEHCGSLDLGIRFLLNQMRCLKPGGVAVHTTEFNLTSNQDTKIDGNCVVYRLKDIESVMEQLRGEGHQVEPICLNVGDHELDYYVDLPPYRKDQHLRLELFGYAATSIGIIIRKAV